MLVLCTPFNLIAKVKRKGHCESVIFGLLFSHLCIIFMTCMFRSKFLDRSHPTLLVN